MAIPSPPAPEAAPLSGCRIELDPATARLDGGVLVGGTPLRLLRLTAVADEALGRLLDGTPAEEPAALGLARLLVDAGLAHPRWDAGPYDLSDVTVIIPIHDRHRELSSLLSHLEGLRTIVVDDASDEPALLADVARRHGATLVRSERLLGPGGARNLGSQLATTPLVCFVDSDVVVEPETIGSLLGHFSDRMIGVVAPRILGTSGPSLRERFERDASPLDMGARAALVRPGGRVSYVPAAVLVVRQELAVDLFDPTLIVGEDVDALWRVLEAGWSARYAPAAHASHPARATWGAWLLQRYRYGRSAAVLEARHGDAAAPLRGSGRALAGWTCLAAGWPIVGISLLAGGVPQLARQLDGTVGHPERTAALLTGRQVLASAPIVARQLVRSYGPLLALGAVLSRRGRRAALGTVLLAGLGRWREADATLDPAWFAALSTIDDLAYAVGLWHGAVLARRGGALRPRRVGGRTRPQAS